MPRRYRRQQVSAGRISRILRARFQQHPPSAPVDGPARRENNSTRNRAARERMFAEDPLCRYCKAPLDPATMTIEHRIPLSRGGTNERANLLLVCKPCNRKKADLMPWEFGV